MQTFRIRLVRPSDAALVARHRARMFQDMGQLSEACFEDFRSKCEARIRAMLVTGEYVGWLACADEQPDRIIAGAGVQLRQTLPHPSRTDDETGFDIAEGRQGLIINVFTEPEWRRRGVAKFLMEEIITWARRQRLDRLVLHASEEGRALYEILGFQASNEMRLAF
jgi:GNAT superfamily N-acetyltransferase